MKVTQADILDAITAACSGPRPTPAADPGYTAQELATHWKVGIHVARQRISTACDAGTIIRGTRYQEDRAGRFVPVPVYRPA